MVFSGRKSSLSNRRRVSIHCRDLLEIEPSEDSGMIATQEDASEMGNCINSIENEGLGQLIAWQFRELSRKPLKHSNYSAK